jgi:hypothetical protein
MHSRRQRARDGAVRAETLVLGPRSESNAGEASTIKGKRAGVDESAGRWLLEHELAKRTARG